MTVSSTVQSFRVRFKRKVRSAETNLFEWRPCSCTLVARDRSYLLQLQTPPRGEHQDGNDEEAIVTIDLATQLVNVVAKKNQSRCNVEYYAPVTTGSRGVMKEELMASSAAQCQQWIAQVRRLQQQVHQLRRLNASTSTRSGDLPVAPLLSSSTSLSEFHTSISNSSSTPLIAAIKPPSVTRRSELTQSEEERSLDRQHLDRSSSFITSTCASPVVVAASCRRCDDAQPTANTSELDHTVDSSCSSPADDREPTVEPVSPLSSISSVSTILPYTAWRKNTFSQLASPSYSSSSDSDISHQSRRCRGSSRQESGHDKKQASSEDDDDPVQFSRRRHSGELNERHKPTGRSLLSQAPSLKSHAAELTASSLSSQELPLNRVSPRTQQQFGVLNRSVRVQEEGESSQAELHILQRVETALRALELENAQVKTRERKLLQEIQTLRDAARVAAAEHNHIQHEYRTTRRELDAWRRAAQSAEAAAAQLDQQLSIAREENQLVAGEKLRLKHQNNELRTQVHRLDSLVYGRF